MHNIPILCNFLCIFGVMKGYLYLIKSKGNRYKIGITKNLKDRVRTIDRTVKGTKERLVMSVRLFNMKFYEKRLHNFFKKRNFEYTGSGKTEWFRLRFWEVVRVKALMIRFRFEQVLVFVVGLYFVYLILSAWISKV